MKYSSTVEDQILKIDFEGDLIGENNGLQLVELTNDALNTGVRYCLINLEKVRYINSSGIGVLITMLTKLRNKKGELYLIKPSEHVKKLLVITKLQAIFNTVENESQALEKISQN